MQTKLQSIWESFINILIGYIVAVLSQLAIFPLFDINIPFSDNLLISLYFTFISLARSYIIRRFFNKKVSIKLQEKKEYRKNFYKDFHIFTNSSEPEIILNKNTEVLISKCKKCNNIQELNEYCKNCGHKTKPLGSAMWDKSINAWLKRK